MMKYDEMCSRHRSEYYHSNQNGLENIVSNPIIHGLRQNYTNGGDY